MSASTETLIPLVAKILNIDPATLRADSQMGGVPGWDSIGHLNLMQALGDHFEKAVPFEQLTELGNLQAIADFFND